jgi:hypothetical protein
MRIIRTLFTACICVLATGCISTAIDRSSSKYRNMFAASTTRDMFRTKLGVPVQNWESGSTNRSEYNVTNSYAYDAFAVRGKIAKPGDGAAQAMINAISLGTSEAIAIPITVINTIEASGQRHTLVVFYDTALHYKRHELYDKNGHKEDTSGY